MTTLLRGLASFTYAVSWIVATPFFDDHGYTAVWLTRMGRA
jgi:hypothetical protein